MSSLQDELFATVKRLSVDIPNRLIGSPGNREAADFISQAFESCGLAVERQDFSCPDWEEISTRLRLDGEELDAFANTFSPSCDLAAPTLPLGSLAELESADISGRILIFYGDLAQHELAAKAAIYVPERDRRIVHILEERSPAALLTINPSLNAHWRLTEDFDLNLPSAAVMARPGLKLLQHAGDRVHLKIDTRRASSHSSNIIGRLAGRRPGKFVLCAHYDTKADTPGAYDNAAGVAVLLALANRMASASNTALASNMAIQKPPYTLEFIAFSGEEGYGLGDMTYARIEDQLDKQGSGGFGTIEAAINFDGVGPRLAANTLASFSASAQMEGLVDEIRLGYPGIVRVDPWPASDHYIFYSHGVPSLAFTSSGIRDIFHTPEDTIDWISPQKLAEAAELGMKILAALMEKDPGWCRGI